MKKLRFADVLRKVDQILLVIVVICFALGGAAWVINSLRAGYPVSVSGPDH